MLSCHNLPQSNKVIDGERDLVAQPGNFQRAVDGCETAALVVSELPSGVDDAKRSNAASNFIRVRPLQRRAIQPTFQSGGVAVKVVAEMLQQSKVVPRDGFEASRPYTASSREQGAVTAKGRGFFYFPVNLPHHCIKFPERWRGWRY